METTTMENQMEKKMENEMEYIGVIYKALCYADDRMEVRKIG